MFLRENLETQLNNHYIVRQIFHEDKIRIH